MPQTTIPTIATSMESDEFSMGFIEGMTGVAHSDNFSMWRSHVENPPTEAGVVEIVRNLCEISAEGWLSEEQLRHDVGLIVGWVSREPGLRVQFSVTGKE